LEPLADKWQAFGFGVMEVDGHDHVEILNALNRTPISKAKPSLVICHTTKGKGFPMAENRAEWHHKSRLSDADIASLYACLG